MTEYIWYHNKCTLQETIDYFKSYNISGTKRYDDSNECAICVDDSIEYIIVNSCGHHLCLQCYINYYLTNRNESCHVCRNDIIVEQSQIIKINE